MEKKIEQRSLAFSLRGVSDKFELAGMALAYNIISSNLGSFRERIAPGAFTDYLATDPDVKCLLNHDANVVLGRTTSGTLTLNDSSTGLNFLCRLDPNQQQHRDLHAAVKRGDISECSFAFRVEDGKEDFTEATDADGKPFLLRTVRRAKLFDVSAVTYPAYNKKGSTSVQARSAANYAAPHLIEESPVTWAALRAKAKRQEYEILMAAPGYRTTWKVNERGINIPTIHAMSDGEVDQRNRDRIERLGYTLRSEELRAEITQLNKELGIID